MKKPQLLLTSLLFFTCLLGNGQVFSVSDNVLNIGVGIGSTWRDLKQTTPSLPPLTVSYDYALRDDLGTGVIGVGGIFSYESHTWKSDLEYGLKVSRTIVAARCSYHYEIIENLDTYGAVFMGVGFKKSKETGDWTGIPKEDKYSGTSFILGLNIGARYNFTDMFGIYGELGYGVAWFVLGVSLEL